MDPRTALITALLLGAAGLVGSFVVNFRFGMIAVLYMVLSLCYSWWLKKLVIVDVMVLAFFYVIRAVAGAEAIDVRISSWLIICTLLLSLFLALGKRRHELTLLNEGAEQHRAILKEYSTQLLDQMISIVTAGTVVVYILYAVSPEVTGKFHTANLIYTTPFVLYGIFRYLYLIHKKESSGNPPSTLLTDPPLLINIAL